MSTLSGVVRVVTHPRVFDPPTSLRDALRYVNALRHQSRVVPLRPAASLGVVHGALRGRPYMRQSGRRCVSRALAIEVGAEFITTDRDVARFRGLRWRHPLE